MSDATAPRPKARAGILSVRRETFLQGWMPHAERQAEAVGQVFGLLNPLGRAYPVALVDRLLPVANTQSVEVAECFAYSTGGMAVMPEGWELRLRKIKEDANAATWVAFVPHCREGRHLLPFTPTEHARACAILRSALGTLRACADLTAEGGRLWSGATDWKITSKLLTDRAKRVEGALLRIEREAAP